MTHSLLLCSSVSHQRRLGSEAQLSRASRSGHARGHRQRRELFKAAGTPRLDLRPAAARALRRSASAIARWPAHRASDEAVALSPRNIRVNMRWEMPSISRRNSLNRRDPLCSVAMMTGSICRRCDRGSRASFRMHLRKASESRTGRCDSLTFMCLLAAPWQEPMRPQANGGRRFSNKTIPRPTSATMDWMIEMVLVASLMVMPNDSLTSQKPAWFA